MAPVTFKNVKVGREGMPDTSKTDEFSEKFRGWGGHSNRKIYIAYFCHYRGYFGHEFQNKFAIFWMCQASLTGKDMLWMDIKT